MVGIRDVANKARVSAGAVSRYLNQDPTLSISTETKSRIDSAIRELNYSKDKKKGGRKTKSSSIGIITAISPKMEMDDPYFRDIRSGIELEAKRLKIAANRRFSLYEGISDKDFTSLSSLGALIIIGNISEDTLASINEINDNIILVDNHSPKVGDSIQVDFETSVYQSLDSLYQLGHRKISFIGGKHYEYGLNQLRNYTENEIRFRSYLQWMNDKGLEKYIQFRLGDWTPIEGKEMVEEILSQELLPTAIMVASDPLAVGVYRGIQKRGYKIPQDISVVSFDDIEIAQFLTPELSTSAVDSNYLGRLSVKLAEERIKFERKLPIKILIPTEYRSRESTLKINQNNA
ncbi:LacI family DNA-binding transcriptional regulator [Paraliobacillus salinarum]|uniref:LacI family DNA-binding transcriptional regulator n=1 Tax=Paraliobacillus salinarum TaxID=1158996 RepID=UPI0015F4EB4E|nr:LacI family DNA-binding transcriptional regulator [Paraliobacillus salinarum]